jgi:uncharacterized protein with PQ loop repeat
MCLANLASMVDAIGWFSSIVLLATILNQVHVQWTSATDQKASIWLFAGQSIASLGFTTYSWLLRNWVFTITNAMLLASAVVGYWIAARQRRQNSKRESDSAASAPTLGTETR